MSAVVRSAPLSNAGSLAVKVFALLFMVGDHVDWFLLDGAGGFHATWGRAVFPLFAFLLACNLGRSVTPRPIAAKVIPRLLAFGLLAHPVYVFLQGQALPLNIMFTLAAAVGVVAALSQGRYLVALVVFALAGGVVDYLWLGVAAVVAPWWAMRRGVGPLPALALACVLLSAWCGSLWPFAAVPVLGLALLLDGDAPRWKWAFYVAYPAHLLVIAGVLYLG